MLDLGGEPIKKPGMITIIDSGVNNLGSLLHAFELIGVEARATRTPSDLENATTLVLPGVGAFGTGMERLREFGLIEGIRRHAIELRRPMIGICLGMQLLTDSSEEHGHHEGLGLIPGATVRLDATSGEDRVPRLGWASVHGTPTAEAAALLPEPGDFYFAHGYHVVCEDPGAVAATTQFGTASIAAVIVRDNILGCQFHPEKSQDAGMAFLSRLIARVSQKPPRLVAAA
jgi:imidazole glycerol-phosphate synthase subunit HisH